MNIRTKTNVVAAFLALLPCLHAQTTPAAAPAAPAPNPMTTPGMVGTLSANPNPMKFDLGYLGNTYVTGVVSGYGQWEGNAVPGDFKEVTDMSNAMVFVQKIDGQFQYFVQAGAYSLPDLGVPYLRSGTATTTFYGTLPQVFVKYAPTDSFSIEAGKLPTLIGAESTWSFENFNIERGLLWNQENAVNRGVQANYTVGSLSLSASLNDGFYSNRYHWLWLSATYAITKADTISFIASGNTKHSNVNSVVTPITLNNEQLYNLIYTHTSGPWTIEPYLQYTKVPKIASFGILHDAATYGAALYVAYAFDPSTKVGDFSLGGFSLPVRLEYISSTGNVNEGAPNLLYGPGSKAWSITLTPTYQYKIFFARAEGSFVEASSITPGAAFGKIGNSKSQARFALEAGILF